MSANIYCRPASTKGKSIPTAAPQSFMESIVEAFGVFPARIGSESDKLVLRGMIAAARGEWKECFKILYQEIEKHGEIVVYDEY